MTPKGISEIKICQNCQQDFIIEPEDFNFYEKINIPPPTFCPECRNQRRMSWRNERSLHKVQCKAPGHTEQIISMYANTETHTVYDNVYWWSDEWDPLDYGQAYDFNKPFFEQFDDLFKKVPMAALSTINSVHSEYTNFVDANKNCYLIFGSGWNENVRYGNKLLTCKDSQDMFMCTKSQLSYECIDCEESYHLLWSFKSKNCSDSYFLYNCKNCTNCFGCSNLVSKSYCMWNTQYTRDEYFKQLALLNIQSYQALREVQEKFFDEIYLPSVHRYANIFSSVRCTGDNINESKNCQNCFEAFKHVENSKYTFGTLDVKETYDGNGVFDNELCYEGVDCNRDAGNFASITTYDSTNVKYAFNCHNLQNCFGCVGLRKKSYCILNKQYSKDEYEKLLPQIIEQMNATPYFDQKGRVYKYGEFFPTEISPFSYNETIAYEYFPLKRAETEEHGYAWLDKESRTYHVDIEANDLPDDLKDVDDSILNKVIGCLHKGQCDDQCTEAFKILPEELQFYKRNHIALPRLCPNCRHFQRLKKRNPLKLWHRVCMCDKGRASADSARPYPAGSHAHQGKCSNEFETSYAPDRPEIVYCEKCYQAEVY